ncbi:reverse transcriptase-like protein [Streptomyces zhihengii]
MREFVVEADGGSRGNPGPAGYGAVVLDPVTGEALAEAAEYIGVATNNVAEYRGLIAGLRAAHRLDPDATVRVRMDSKLVVEQMSGRWKIKHPDMKPLAAEAARILPASRVTYEWIPRERNKHADRLANEAMDAGRAGRQWEATPRAASPVGVSRPGLPPPRRGCGGLRGRGGLRFGVRVRVRLWFGVRVRVRLRGRVRLRLWFRVRLRGVSVAGASVRTAPPRGGVPPRTWARPPPSCCCATGRRRSPPRSASRAAAAATRCCPRRADARRTPSRRRSPRAARSRRSSPPRCGAAARPRRPWPSASACPSSSTRACARRTSAPGRGSPSPRCASGTRTTWTPGSPPRRRRPRGRRVLRHGRPPRGRHPRAPARRPSGPHDAARHPRHPDQDPGPPRPGGTPEALFRMELSAASLSAVAYYADGNASLRLLNDTSALR